MNDLTFNVLEFVEDMLYTAAPGDFVLSLDKKVSDFCFELLRDKVNKCCFYFNQNRYAQDINNIKSEYFTKLFELAKAEEKPSLISAIFDYISRCIDCTNSCIVLESENLVGDL